MIINLIGQPGAGKTSIAKFLLDAFSNSVHIDGDDLRDLFKNKDYSQTGRRNNIQNAYNIAIFLESKGFIPVISLVSPYLDLREDLKARTNTSEFLIKTTEIRGRESFHVNDYQMPETNFIEIDTTNKEAIDMANIIKTIVNEKYKI